MANDSTPDYVCLALIFGIPSGIEFDLIHEISSITSNKEFIQIPDPAHVSKQPYRTNAVDALPTYLFMII